MSEGHLKKNGEWLCPVCDTKWDSQHSFTVHIRQHNPTDHSHTCSICGKTLSSASSLDRHMLIHSGERPFKCKICNMTFTTNGNMHRHMRTHGTTSNENAAPDSPRSPHLKSKDSSRSPQQTSKDSSRSLQHTPKDSPRSLHHTPKDSPRSPHHTSKDSGYSPNDNNQNGNGSTSIGFHDLTFTDFSSHKYPLIAQSFCESNIRKSSSPYHNFQCSNCPKAFPCAAALSLHQQKSHNSSIISTDHTSLKMETPESQSKPSTLSSTFCHICQIDLGSSVEYAAHQTKHRYDSFLSSVVKGVNLTSSTSSPSINFSKAIVTNPSITTDKLPSIDNADVVIKNFSNDDDNDDEDHQQYLSNDNEKEQFLAMLQLHKKNINNSLVKVQSIDGSSPFRDLESNAKPPFNRLNKNSITNSSKTKSKIKSKVNSKTSSRKLDGPLTDKTKEVKKQAKHDLADSNYTNSKDSLLKNVTSCSSLLSFANSSSLDSKKTSFKRRRLLSTPTSSVRSPSRASASLPLQDTDKMNGENSNPPSIEATSSSPSEDGEKEMEIDLPENNSSGTSGSMGKENSEEMDTGETAQQNSSMNANVPQPNHRCEICALEFKTFNALKRHNRGHTKSGHNYVCNMCSYTSLDKSTLVRHLRTHNGERPFQCAICKYAFTTKSNCERHVRKRHKKLSKPEIKSSMLFNAGLTKSSPTSDSSQVTIQNITRHNNDTRLPNISGPEWPGPNDTLCRHCNLDLESNKALRHHIKTLHALSQKPYSCTLCKMGFSTKNNCIRHVIRLHPEMKKDIKSIVLVNGTSVNGNSQSGSDEISESEAATLGETSQNGGNSTIGTIARRKTNASSTSSTIKHSQPLNSASNCSFTETSNPPPSIPLPNASGHEDPVDAITLAWQFHSSLAALCQIISPISPIAGNSTSTVATVPGLTGTVERKSLSTVTEDYDGDESNSEYQPLDLAKTSDSEKEPIPSKGTPRNQPIPTRLFHAHCEPQPLDLAAHALDLSVKTTPTKVENQCLVDLNKCSEPIRTAASSLLALQSFIPASK